MANTRITRPSGLAHLDTYLIAGYPRPTIVHVWPTAYPNDQARAALKACTEPSPMLVVGLNSDGATRTYIDTIGRMRSTRHAR